MSPSTVDELLALLHRCKGAWDTPDRSGDPVDLHDHALQTAALLRRDHPDDPELQLAGLVSTSVTCCAPATTRVTRRRRRTPYARCSATGWPAWWSCTSRPSATSPRRGRTAPCRRRASSRSRVRAVRWHRTRWRRSRRPLPQALNSASLRSSRGYLIAAAAVALRQADDAGKLTGLHAGCVDDWRPVLERVTAAVG